MKFLSFLGSITNVVLAEIFSGWAITLLWSWFIVPTFSLAALSLVPAIGLSLVVSYLTYRPKFSDTTAEGSKFNQKMMWIKPIAFIAIGFIVQLFM